MMINTFKEFVTILMFQKKKLSKNVSIPEVEVEMIHFSIYPLIANKLTIDFYKL